MKKILMVLLAVAVVFSFAACDDSGSDNKEPVITDPTDTGNSDILFYDNFTSDTAEYYFTASEDYANQKSENGKGVLYGGAQYLSVDIADSSKTYRMSYDVYLNENFDIASSAQQSFGFSQGTGTPSGNRYGVAFAVVDGSKDGTVTLKDNVGADAISANPIFTDIPSDSKIGVTVLFTPDGANTKYEMTLTADGKAEKVERQSAVVDGSSINEIWFSIFGPAADYKTAGDTPFASIDNIKVEVVK